ncbi:hypothetical protein CEXT_778751 [Caerostris extrusa]|uniref:Uncharacterized protein n=1 Tax=Caerostris extrusa TaxID=172846 RepID=A0AAV4X730_CAEEX|nr:hypothetical protein CEXT_778751 [Caerostris extrusa]
MDGFALDLWPISLAKSQNSRVMARAEMCLELRVGVALIFYHSVLMNRPRYYVKHCNKWNHRKKPYTSSHIFMSLKNVTLCNFHGLNGTIRREPKIILDTPFNSAVTSIALNTAPFSHADVCK